MDSHFPKNTCRICISTNENVVKIEDTCLTIDNNTTPLLDILNLLSDIKINENYPDTICSDCVEKANNTFQFKLQCDQSNKILENRTQKMELKESVTNLIVKEEIAVNTADLKPTLEDTNTEKNERIEDPVEESHTDVRPYLCTTCGKSFRYVRGLLAHTRTHTNERPFKCDVCQKAFTLQPHLSRHSKIHTGERPFPCKLCDKAFIKKYDLQRHQTVHSGIRPFVCSLCSKTFVQRNHLKYHLMNHNNEKPHVCSLCGRDFIRKSNLKGHMCKRHPEYSFKEENNE